MKIDMYMFDRPVELNDESTDDFIKQYKNAKDTMHQLLTMFEDEDTRIAIFYVLSLRSYLDDFLEFCMEGLTVDELEALLNDEVEYEDDDDDFEIEVDVNDDEE